MAPIIRISDDQIGRAKKLLESGQIDYDLVPEAQSSIPGFIYVPSINMDVAIEKTLHGKNWFESHIELQGNGFIMLPPFEFTKFLKYTRDNHQDIYKEITEVRSPLREEWLDANFKVRKDGQLYVYDKHVLNKDGKIISQRPPRLLQKNTLRQNRKISLEYWIRNSTGQGLPIENSKEGEMHYWAPMDDDKSVARFDVGPDGINFACSRIPSFKSPNIGVRAAKRRE